MRLSIKYKIFGPLILCALVFGGLGYWYLQNQLDLLQDGFLEQIAANKYGQVTSDIDMLGTQAVEKAAFFAQLPEVVEAFELAHSGDIDNPADPRGQEAREHLRRDLRSILKSFESVAGYKVQLHFHLPNSRSLARMWREKQTRKDGKWVDISDDLSAFRSTVKEVNTTGRPVKGIELGRSGFVIRGLAPVTAPDGQGLGSVEVLVSFAPLLKAVAMGRGQDVALYMLSDFLSITTALKDERKFPLLGGRFVTVAPAEGQLGYLVDTELLDRAVQGETTRVAGNLALAGFPIKDFKGRTIGAMVYSGDISTQRALIQRLGMIFGLVLVLILAISIGIGSLVFMRSVQRPTRAIIRRIKDIAEDKADLRDPLIIASRDEMGELSRWFNALMVKIDAIICRTEVYMNIMNALQDPMFAVDDEFKILIGNSAMARIAGVPQEKLPEMSCREVLNTPLCGTDQCPIEQVKRTGKHVQCDTLELNIDHTRRVVRPYGDVLFDCHGTKAGYFEVAQDVTELHDQERKLSGHLENVEEINRKVADASARIAGLSDTVAEQVEVARQGSETQRRRVIETATAMEQMNSTILEVAQSAGKVAEEAEQAVGQAREGAAVVGQAVEAIGHVHSLAEDLKRSMDDLGSQTEDIGRIITVIQDIADQTNLLALNAAIEAARAGDMGRGFAVVADEVRKLAEKTMNATQDVGQAISAIQVVSRRSMEGMDQAGKAVDRATGQASESGRALESIVALVESTTDQVRSIASAAEEQSATSEEITRAMDEVHRISGETAEGMSASARAVNDLAELAQNLKQLSEAS